MCRVNMDLTEEKNFNFAVYNMVLAKSKDFSAEELIDEMSQYQVMDREHITKQIRSLLKCWVNSGMIRQDLDSYSVAV